MTSCLKTAVLFLLSLTFLSQVAYGQAEVRPWGNVEGIRVDGQLMTFNSSLCTADAQWSEVTRTAKERQEPGYERENGVKTITTRLGSLAFSEEIRSTGRGSAEIVVDVTAESDTMLAGAFLCLELPGAHFANAPVQLIEPDEDVSLTAQPTDGYEYLRRTANGVRFGTPTRQLDVTFDEPTEVIVRKDPREASDDVHVFLALLTGEIDRGQTAHRNFSMSVSGEVDDRPVTLVMDATQPGRVFDGLGGNFRLQNPETDPQVIQYVLDNMRVAWGRVEMPWQHWHPEEDVDPIATAEAGGLHPRVHAAMQMAQQLARRNMPVVVSAWFAPSWAIVEEEEASKRARGVRGDSLDPAKMDQIYESIAAYLVYLKNQYGVEAVMFSFNESDLGIDVRQTAEEHAALIEELGAYLGERGLATKMLLGDTSDANALDFIEPAMDDPEVLVHVDALSFHSWRGWDDETLTAWGDAAKELDIPLIIGEGSTDAAAWKYDDVFEEPWFALQEINLYTRILALAEPKSILQWQLTADYSIMVGGGIFGNEEPLHPTQRFWNLKQLASTPAGAFNLPLTCDHPDVSCAAFGDIAEGDYAVHVVNNGAARSATLTGLPEGIDALRVYVTDSERDMEEGATVPVDGGTASMTLPATSFTTLAGSM